MEFLCRFTSDKVYAVHAREDAASNHLILWLLPDRRSHLLNAEGMHWG